MKNRLSATLQGCPSHAGILLLLHCYFVCWTVDEPVANVRTQWLSQNISQTDFPEDCPGHSMQELELTSQDQLTPNKRAIPEVSHLSCRPCLEDRVRDGWERRR